MGAIKNNWLDRWMAENNHSIWGVADLRQWPTPLISPGFDYPRAISWAVPMAGDIMASIKNGPNQTYARLYASTNNHINNQADRLTESIIEKGHQAMALAASERTDKINIRGDFPHKTAATQAGLGWIGRHCQLITRRFGPWVRLGTVFTDMDLTVNIPMTRSYCGQCRKCVDACPAGALAGGAWEPGTSREKLLDAKRCDKWKKEHYFHYHQGHNCGICAAVCPYGLKTIKKNEVSPDLPLAPLILKS